MTEFNLEWEDVERINEQIYANRVQQDMDKYTVLAEEVKKCVKHYISEYVYGYSELTDCYYIKDESKLVDLLNGYNEKSVWLIPDWEYILHSILDDKDFDEKIKRYDIIQNMVGMSLVDAGYIKYVNREELDAIKLVRQMINLS